MARSLLEQAVANVGVRRGRASALALGRTRRLAWLAPGLLALATVLALVAAYSVRPFVAIDIGDYYDRAYLPNLGESESDSADFHAREVNAISEPQITAWPAGQEYLELPGRRQGIWKVAVEPAPGLPDDALEGLTVAANGVRLWNPPGAGPRELLAIVPANVMAAETVRLRLEPAVVGDPDPPLGLAGQIKLAQAETYRWTGGQSTISLPGIGRGDWNVTLFASLRHPDNQPLNAVVSANGVPVAKLPDGGPRQFSFLVPAVLVPDGDLTLSISSNVYKDPRELGILLYDLRVAPAGSTALLPPLKALLYALAIALCLYFCLQRLIANPAVAGALALAVILGGAWALAEARFPSAFMSPRLALLALWSVALLLALEWLLPRLFAAAGVQLSDWLLRSLLLVFFVGYWIKVGGMLYPYFVGIDMRLQMTWARNIWNGQFWLYYGIDNPMNTRTMPVADWGPNPPVIPYSPWFHIFAGSFSLLPLPMVLTGHLFSALIDTSRVFLLALLARKSRFSDREALFGSLLLAVTPATFLLHSWGNLPTTLGLWCTLVTTIYIAVAYRRLDRPWPFVVLTLMITITLLAYTVVAAFMGLFLCLAVPALWLIESRWLRTKGRASVPDLADEPPIENRRPVVALALAGFAGLALAILIYYGQYIPVMLERTLPYFLQSGRPEELGVTTRRPTSLLSYLAQRVPFTTYLQRPVAYGIQLPLLLALPALAEVGRPRLRALLICWALVAAVFTIAGLRIDMVDKQMFYLLPALVLLTGRLLSQLWQRGMPARLVVASVYLFTFTAALDLWAYRVMTTRQ
ncbi:MAG TPA: hypothetical protein VFU22_26855 [Roseiflexaceae bacterium]|nr:hypothetical protein [Roseiflexaceae bacterium]